jgi:hypothetical protein
VCGAGGDIGSDDLRVSSLVVYETLSLDGEFGATKDLDQCPGELDLTNSETDGSIREQFHSQAQGAGEGKEHVLLSHRWKDNRRKLSR